MCGWGGSGGKGQRRHAVYCRWVSVREPDCMRVPSQGPHGGGAVRCYTGNGPMRHAFCTRVRCGVRELRAGVDPIKILKILKASLAASLAEFLLSSRESSRTREKLADRRVSSRARLASRI